MFAAVTPCTSDKLNGMDYNMQGDCRESNDNFQKYDSYIWGGYMSSVKISWEFYATTKLGQQHWPPVYGCSLYSVFIQVQALLYLTSEIRPKIFHIYDAALQRLIGCLLRTEIHTKTTANERENRNIYSATSYGFCAWRKISLFNTNEELIILPRVNQLFDQRGNWLQWKTIKHGPPGSFLNIIKLDQALYQFILKPLVISKSSLLTTYV